MQSDAGLVLGEEAGLHGPDPAPLGRDDHCGQQGPANPAPLGLGGDVDSVLGHPGIGAAIRHRGQCGPAHHPPVQASHQPVPGQVSGVPRRPLGRGGLEGRVAGGNPSLVNGADRRPVAEDYASWFRCLADPTRIQILRLLATSDAPMTVGDIVRRVGVGQSTVSHHLKVLAQVRFVTVEHAGTSSRYQVNPRCLAAFPTAAEVVMGRRPAR